MLINVVVYVLTFLEVLTALLLIGIILIQQSKAGGGLGAVGGGVTETVFGATAGNVLTRGTVILASIFLGITLLLAVITGHSSGGRSVVDDMAPEEPAAEMPATQAEDAAAAVAPAEAEKAAAADAVAGESADAEGAGTAAAEAPAEETAPAKQADDAE
jgi:preprotein translocase subunit SecG